MWLNIKYLSGLYLLGGAYNLTTLAQSKQYCNLEFFNSKPQRLLVKNLDQTLTVKCKMLPFVASVCQVS